MQDKEEIIFKVQKLAEKAIRKQIAQATKQLSKASAKWLIFNCFIAANNKVDADEGHFSVIVFSNGEPKKFLVRLSYLAHPQFLKLLDAAAEEYGYDQKGILVLPCDESELQRVLSKPRLY